jgi:hypothetical protein
VFALLCAGGCDADDASHADDAAQDATDADDARLADAGEPDAAALPIPTTTGSNVSFDSAWPIAVDARGVLQDVRSVGQVDYFVFEAKAGTFYELATGRRTFGPDTVMMLFDREQRLLAENDDGPRFPGDPIDARLVVRAAHSGKYYVRIEDPYTPEDVFSNPSYPLLYYRFWVRALNARAAGAVHARPGRQTEIGLVRDEASGYDCATLIGEFAEGETDLFALAGKADHALIGHVHSAGEHGGGSTARGGVVVVSDAQHHPLAKVDRASGVESIHPPLGEGAYEVSVAASGDPGANGFYALDLVLLPDNPRERDDLHNGAPEGAEALDMPGAPQRRGLLLSTLPADDVDYYQFDAQAGDAIQVACEAESGGSGVRGLHVEVQDAAGETLLAGLEWPNENLLLEGLEITSARKLFLRLSSDGAAAEGGESLIEPWTRCVVIAGP